MGLLNSYRLMGKSAGYLRESGSLSNMSACFVYGTLMAEDVLARVLYGRKDLKNSQITLQDATLVGYKRYRLKGRDYPGVMAAGENDSVVGRLVSNVQPHEIAKLDHFEGEEYKRTAINVKAADGSVHSAEAYIYERLEFLDPAAGDWDFDAFTRDRKQAWIADELGETQGLGGRFWQTTQREVN